MMDFGEKLQFLMILTNTSNSALAKNAALDASYISRLKNGDRKPVARADYLSKMASYFSKKINGSYLLGALEEVIFTDTGRKPNAEELSKALLQWFQSYDHGNTEHLDRFLTQFSNINLEQQISKCASISVDHSKDSIQIFHGITGKRSAVLTFLSEILQRKKPVILHLYSDENMSWLTDDLIFASQWAALLKEVLLMGCRIRIIHNINRDLDELLSAINQWLPLYMTGAIEPFYYPRVRDGVFNRTVFVAPSLCAVVSSSIGNQHQSAANLLFLDPKDVDCFQSEFEQYLSLCRPLMTIFTPKDRVSCVASLVDFDKIIGDTILLHCGLSLVTMPIALVQKLMETVEQSVVDHHMHQHHLRYQSFENLTQSHHYIEILQLADVMQLDQGQVPVLYSDYFDLPSAYYLKEDYFSHLEQILYLLETRPNYHVYLSKNQLDHHFSLYVKENAGAIIAKSGPSSAVFALSENYLTGAFWDYSKKRINHLSSEDKDRSKVIKKIREYIKSHR